MTIKEMGLLVTTILDGRETAYVVLAAMLGCTYHKT